MGTTIELTAADGHRFAAYRAEPAGKPRGALVVIQEIFGVNSHIRGVADGYAADGYLAIAPALFDRSERGLDIGYSQPEIERGRAIMQKVTMDDALKDVAAAIKYGRPAQARSASSATAGAGRSRSSPRRSSTGSPARCPTTAAASRRTSRRSRRSR